MKVREKIISYAKDKYGTDPEYLWLKTPDSAVLRNTQNKKWYGLIMNIRRSAVGLDGEGCIDVLNVKCSSLVREVLIGEGKAVPAYHMNKKLWISIPFTDKITIEEICGALDESYDLVNR